MYETLEEIIDNTRKLDVFNYYSGFQHSNKKEGFREVAGLNTVHDIRDNYRVMLYNAAAAITMNTSSTRYQHS